MPAKYCPMAFLVFALSVPVSIASQYLEIYLPSLVVSEVTARHEFSRAITAVGFVMLAMLLCGILGTALESIKNALLGFYRCHLNNLLHKKCRNIGKKGSPRP